MNPRVLVVGRQKLYSYPKQQCYYTYYYYFGNNYFVFFNLNLASDSYQDHIPLSSSPSRTETPGARLCYKDSIAYPWGIGDDRHNGPLWDY